MNTTLVNDFSILVAEALIFASSYLSDRIIELPNRYETVGRSKITTLCDSNILTQQH
ncbi:hypothetical protein [Nostoc sp.]